MKKILLLFLCLLSLGLTASSVLAKAKTQEIEKNAEYYYKQGLDYEWKNNRLGAIDIYTKALEIDPSFNDARIARAKLYYFFEKYDKALEDFNYFYNQPNYGAAVYYEYRIDCKKKLGMYSEALDDMYEVILAYGGQARVLNEMQEMINEHPEYSNKLEPESHTDLLIKYSAKAPEIRGYAETYAKDENNPQSIAYYKFFRKIARKMDELAPQKATPASSGIRTAPAEGEVIDTIKY